MVAADSRIWAAVAFWGRGIEEVFRTKAGCEVRIICNLESGGCNPEVIKTLIDGYSKGAVKQLNNLHAKVVIGDSSALIGSANFSANGLGLEGAELTKWREASVLTSDPELLAQTEKWFEGLWKVSKPIETRDLLEAQRRWDLRRLMRKQKGRPFGGFIADMPREILASEKISVIVWRDKASDKAQKTFSRFKKAHSGLNVGEFDFFEDATNLPSTGTLISVYFGARGAMTIDGLYLRKAKLDLPVEKFKSIQIIEKKDDILGRAFSQLERDKLLAKISANVRLAWELDGDGNGPVISLEEAIYGLKAIRS
jgi:hypothetical protein